MIVAERIHFETRGYRDVFNITDEVEKLVTEHGLELGHVLLFAVGSTTGLTTLEYEPGLIADIQDFLEDLLPYRDAYKHHATWGDDNGSSHLQSALLGTDLLVPVEKGRLVLGTWQQIVFLDLDTRPRRREVVVHLHF
jgi:secondary thiamine-phosphate synthase enzyme